MKSVEFIGSGNVRPSCWRWASVVATGVPGAGGASAISATSAASATPAIPRMVDSKAHLSGPRGGSGCRADRGPQRSAGAGGGRRRDGGAVGAEVLDLRLAARGERDQQAAARAGGAVAQGDDGD